MVDQSIKKPALGATISPQAGFIRDAVGDFYGTALEPLRMVPATERCGS